MEEIWKNVTTYQGSYLVSNHGNIFSIKSGKNMKSCKTKDGYLTVALSDKGKGCRYLIHRLVADAFIGLVGKNYVNHKNGIKSNNRLDNLEIVTPRENAIHSCYILGNGRKLNENNILEILKLNKDGFSIKSISEKYGVSKTCIRYVLNGKSYSKITQITYLKTKTRRKLTPLQINEIKKLSTLNVPIKNISELLGIGKNSVSNVVTGRSYNQHNMVSEINGEIFKKISGFDNYQISNLGRVINAERNKILKTYLHHGGYLNICLNKNGKSKSFIVHRLVASTFLGDITNMVINHKDGDKLNNSVQNLEIVSSLNNSLHSCYILGNNLKLTTDQVLGVVQMYNNGVNMSEIGKIYHVKRRVVNAVLLGKTWSHITGITYTKSSGIKLDKKQVIEIIKSYHQNGMTTKQISNIYLISKATVNDILAGRRWSKITGIIK